MRRNSVYLLISLQVVVLFAAGAVAIYVSTVAHRIQDAEQRAYSGCLRGNTLRAVARHTLLELGDSESLRLAELPALKPQPCDVIYPGGKA